MKKKTMMPKYDIGQIVYVIDSASRTICPTCNQQTPSLLKGIIVQAEIEEIHILRTCGAPEIYYVLERGKTEEDRETLHGQWDESCVYVSKKIAQKEMKNY